MTFLIACLEPASMAPSMAGVKLRLEGLGADRSRVRFPPARIEQQQRAQSPDVVVNELAAVVQGSSEHGVARVFGRERGVVHDERTRHSRLDDKTLCAEIDDRVLGSAEDIDHPGAVEVSQEPPPGDAAEHVVVTQ